MKGETMYIKEWVQEVSEVGWWLIRGIVTVTWRAILNKIASLFRRGAKTSSKPLPEQRNLLKISLKELNQAHLV